MPALTTGVAASKWVVVCTNYFLFTVLVKLLTMQQNLEDVARSTLGDVV